MSNFLSSSTRLGIAVLLGTVFLLPTVSGAQTLADPPPVTPPSPLAVVPTADQQQALQNATAAQIQELQAVVTPGLQQAIQNYQPSTVANYRTWQDIVTNGSSAQNDSLQAQAAGSATQSGSSSGATIHFISTSGVPLTATASKRVYHPAATTAKATTKTSASLSLLRPQCCVPIRPNPDQDGDGLPDNPDLGDIEDPVAKAFMPIYHISTGEQQQFATYGNYVPWTVINTVGTNPPNSYYHVSPLGLATDSFGNQLYALRVDYLSLWNADGGLIGGGAACFYSYFGLDSVINDLSGHDLDAERSVMLLAAPAVNGAFNPDANAYSLYSIYTAAHEGTFFDQSLYTDFTTPVPAGNHIDLYQSLSKHSTYGFNPDYYPITPAWFIDATNDAIVTAYLDGDIDDLTYALLLAAADDTFFGCLVERFGDQGGVAPSPVSNVGEVSHPLNGNGFIQDDSSRALNLADKLTDHTF